MAVSRTSSRLILQNNPSNSTINKTNPGDTLQQQRKQINVTNFSTITASNQAKKRLAQENETIFKVKNSQSLAKSTTLNSKQTTVNDLTTIATSINTIRPNNVVSDFTTRTTIARPSHRQKPLTQIAPQRPQRWPTISVARKKESTTNTSRTTTTSKPPTTASTTTTTTTSTQPTTASTTTTTTSTPPTTAPTTTKTTPKPTSITTIDYLRVTPVQTTTPQISVKKSDNYQLDSKQQHQRVHPVSTIKVSQNNQSPSSSIDENKSFSNKISKQEVNNNGTEANQLPNAKLYKPVFRQQPLSTNLLLLPTTVANINQALYQRRTPQTILGPRYTTGKPGNQGRNQFGGEHWSIFTRPDGFFSLVEILVILSNIIIVVTIITILSIHCWRLYKKRQAQAASPTSSSSSSSPPNKDTATTSNSGIISSKLSKLGATKLNLGGKNSTTDATTGNARLDKMSTGSSITTLQPTLLDDLGTRSSTATTTTTTTNLASGLVNDAGMKVMDTITSGLKEIGDTASTEYESRGQSVIMNKYNQANMMQSDNDLSKLAAAGNSVIIMDETNQKVSGGDLTAITTKSSSTNNSGPTQPTRQLSKEYTSMMNANNKAMAIVQPTETNNNSATVIGGGSDEKQQADRDQINKLTHKTNGIETGNDNTVMVQFEETTIGASNEHQRRDEKSRDKIDRKETISMIINETSTGDNNKNKSINSDNQKQSTKQDDADEIRERVNMVEQVLFNTTNDQSTNGGSNRLKEHTIDFYNMQNSTTTTTTTTTTNRKLQTDDSGKMVKINSVDSIELPAALVNSIRSSDPSNDDNPEERPTPNPLIEVARATQPNSSGKQSSQQNNKSSNVEKKGHKSAQQQGAGVNQQRVTTDKQTKMALTKNTKSPGPVSILKKQESSMEPISIGGELLKKTTEENQDISLKEQQQQTATGESAVSDGVGHHPTVVNKLDRRKTDLEIVDVRDKSVVGKIKFTNEISGAGGKKTGDTSDTNDWITMEGVAVVGQQQQQQVPSSHGAISGILNLIGHGGHQSASNSQHANDSNSQQQQHQQQMMVISPSEIIESRFKIDYASNDPSGSDIDDERGSTIDTEIELDRAMKNRKYFIYIVHDGHFNARKECIARIELPQKRRITLAELRNVIATSTDISLSSLRKNRFKFVTETYRLLSENEDNAVLHHVYPTQGVFLKLNIPDQDTAVYPYKGRPRQSSQSLGSGGASTLSQGTIASRSRVRNVTSDTPRYGAIRRGTGPPSNGETNTNANRYRSRSSGASTLNRGGVGRGNRLPSINVYGTKGSLMSGSISDNNLNGKRQIKPQEARHSRLAPARQQMSGVNRMVPGQAKHAIASTSDSVKTGVISGAKRLFNATFKKR